MSADEDDFMSDKFLKAASAPDTVKATETYAEKRAKALRKGLDAGRVKSKREREAEAREDGLARNLITARAEYGEDSKALAMMLKMGFKPGQGLGKRKSPPPAGQTQTPSDSAHRVEPIEVQVRLGRSGIGTQTAAAKRLKLDPRKIPPLDEIRHSSSYLARHRDGFDERKSEGILRKARRTLEELDRRAGTQDNVLWISPEDDAVREERRIRNARLGMTVEYDDSDDERAGTKRHAPLNDEEVPLSDDEDGPKITSATRDSFSALDARTRLSMTLDYLRETHHYCFWCGAKYDDEADMASNCPGEAEADH
ncbi:uncharacterized protein L969DRAFT_52665 [Mixia osmundae IAM 14324]|uniref:G-patch domain-containing protein n=1 Tax=Mixia osmundae (strain CBS 9802 / IAM 14324 / JCM 22182 / KY 12970) TaxID=764103 RepID=G7E534_MIXOS|nr:uncharacterized protein L969DRAFT_52665 [Mixia osmundae IAM 14324]KEI37806.1 hypothetical protein L969DRAFT_52665 [Mixia osmundae IAM 14324]GAA97944.1 hypothetical protein E5Q_04624 [Mixia osmundae IAM 14324]